MERCANKGVDGPIPTWKLSTICLKLGLAAASELQQRSISALYCCSVRPGLPGSSESNGTSGRVWCETALKMTCT